MQAISAHTVAITDTGESFSCKDHEALLAAMVKIERKGIPVGCLNGGCGVCKVRIVQGAFENTGPISRAHVSMDESANNITLACRAAPTSDVVLEILGKMKKSFLANCGKPRS